LGDLREDFGVVVIGSSPGTASNWEKMAYAEAEVDPQIIGDQAALQIFEAIDHVCWERVTAHVHPYYVTIRHFIRAVGYVGPIYWTEAVKCQGSHGRSTKRSCALGLNDEIEERPGWAIFFVGGAAFEAYDQLNPKLLGNRVVMRLPHPSGRQRTYSWPEILYRISKLPVEKRSIFRDPEKMAQHGVSLMTVDFLENL